MRAAAAVLLVGAAVDALHAHAGARWSSSLERHVAAAHVSHVATAHAARSSSATMQHSKGWDDFGKPPFNFYKGFEEFMKVFPDEDRELYPEMFKLPTGVYEVALPRPLGIAFEEREVGRGVIVTECVEGGNAAESGLIEPDDVLIAVTAVKAPGAMSRFERKLIPCKSLDYDTIVGAIGTNESPRCDNVVLQFMRPSACDEAQVDTFLEFFEVPPTHVFRTN